MRFNVTENDGTKMEFDAIWFYDEKLQSATTRMFGKPISSHITKCTLSIVHDDKVGKDRFQPIIETKVSQDSRDQFVRSEGRKRSLTKALGKLTSTLLEQGRIGYADAKKIRSDAWDAYFKDCDKGLIRGVSTKERRKKNLQTITIRVEGDATMALECLKVMAKNNNIETTTEDVEAFRNGGTKQ